MFPSFPHGKMCCGNNFCCSETKIVFAWSQKHFYFPETTFVSETYVSQFSHHKKKLLTRFQCCSFELFQSQHRRANNYGWQLKKRKRKEGKEFLIALYECLWDVTYYTLTKWIGTKGEVAYYQIDAEMSERYHIARDNYKMEYSEITIYRREYANILPQTSSEVILS